MSEFYCAFCNIMPKIRIYILMQFVDYGIIITIDSSSHCLFEINFVYDSQYLVIVLIYQMRLGECVT